MFVVFNLYIKYLNYIFSLCISLWNGGPRTMRRWLCELQVCFDILTLTMMYVLALFECMPRLEGAWMGVTKLCH